MRLTIPRKLTQVCPKSVFFTALFLTSESRLSRRRFGRRGRRYPTINPLPILNENCHPKHILLMSALSHSRFEVVTIASCQIATSHTHRSAPRCGVHLAPTFKLPIYVRADTCSAPVTHKYCAIRKTSDTVRSLLRT